MCHKRFPGQKATLCIVQENVNKSKQDRKFWDLSSPMDWIVKFLKMNYINKLSVSACARRPAARWISMESTLHCKETLRFPCTCDLTESQWMQKRRFKIAKQHLNKLNSIIHTDLINCSIPKVKLVSYHVLTSEEHFKTLHIITVLQKYSFFRIALLLPYTADLVDQRRWSHLLGTARTQFD